MLVTGSGIASAELQLWEGSGVRCISPLDAGDAERLGAAWILAAGKALGPRLEVCSATIVDYLRAGKEGMAVC